MDQTPHSQNQPCTTPILFLVFNRPDTTKIVFDEIKKSQPKKLFIAADGPRNGNYEDTENCEIVREIVTGVDWDCDVHTLFRKKNLGCKHAISGALDWFFSNVEDGIILEDDTLPHPKFFRFCEELIARYRNQKNIIAISGDNFQHGKRRGENSYYFSKYVHIWGWATWKRAWELYDVNMKEWAHLKSTLFLKRIHRTKTEVAYWKTIFDRVYSGKIDTWDYQLLFAAWVNDACCVIPNGNLIKNIGFSKNATHTARNSRYANMAYDELKFPLKHPDLITINAKADTLVGKTFFKIRLMYVWFLLKRTLQALSGHFTKM